MKTNGNTRYFTSFSASSSAIVPLNEVDLKAAQELTTYYEARFDSRGLVTRFIKYLKQHTLTTIIFGSALDVVRCIGKVRTGKGYRRLLKRQIAGFVYCERFIVFVFYVMLI